MSASELQKIPAPPRELTAKAKEILDRAQGIEIVFMSIGYPFQAPFVFLLVLLILGFDPPTTVFPPFLLLSFVGIFLMAFAWHRKWRRRWAFTHGHAAEGKIESAGPDVFIRINHQHPHRVIWSFQAEGKTYQGKLWHKDAKALQNYQPNQKAVILYEPKKPQINTLYLEP